MPNLIEGFEIMCTTLILLHVIFILHRAKLQSSSARNGSPHHRLPVKLCARISQQLLRAHHNVFELWVFTPEDYRFSVACEREAKKQVRLTSTG